MEILPVSSSNSTANGVTSLTSWIPHDYITSTLNDIDKKIDSSTATDDDQQSRIQLMKEQGDENSKFFHGILKHKRRQQSIQGILVEGDWISNPHLIKEEFYKFYKSNFQTFDSSFDVNSNPDFATLCLEEIAMLQQQATLDEIRKAVWDCGSGKSPRPDGFSFLFLKKYWDIFEDNVAVFINNFMESGTMPKGTNSAFITLISKTPNPILIKDYHSISLIGMKYKIVAKLLANRFSTVLNKLVSPTQSAYISGQQILDSPLMVSEIIEWYRKHDKRLMIFKVDFEKAFDSDSYDIQQITCSLNSFYQASGLRINIAKYNLFAIGVSAKELQTMAHVTGCQASSFPISYLGLPIGKSMHYLLNWNILVDKFKSKLSNWKVSLLSIGGGLGIGSLKAFSLALLQKWRWIFNTNSDLLWVKLIKAIHGSEAGFDGKGCDTSGVWSSIVSTTNYLHSQNLLPKDTLKCHLENGSFIHFWKDLWLGNKPLCSRYNRLFHLDIDENCLISDQCNAGSWNWQWSRPVDSGRTASMLLNLQLSLLKLPFLLLQIRGNGILGMMALFQLLPLGHT
ncbi:RNA-directed DNA polymerase, eukaryota, reverse transcriptase zinc-binding domain protein [Tanacetum coccineum]